MSHSHTSSWVRRLGALAALLCGLVIALPVASESDSKREYWVERYQQLTESEQTLRKQLESARARYSRGRSSNRLRGDERADLMEDISRLEQELAKVESHLATFEDDARAAGALPGWFRDL